MLGRGTVQPDDIVADVDLTVHDPALIVAVEPTRSQAERADQEVLAGLDVVVHEQWGYPQ